MDLNLEIDRTRVFILMTDTNFFILQFKKCHSLLSMYITPGILRSLQPGHPDYHSGLQCQLWQLHPPYI